MHTLYNIYSGHIFRLKDKQYTIKNVLGEGAYGLVFLVETETGKLRVIKDIKSKMVRILMQGQYYNDENGYNEAQALDALYLGKQYKGTSSDNQKSRWLIKQKYFNGMNFDDYNSINTIEGTAAAGNNRDRFHQVLDLSFQLAIQQVLYFHGLKMQHGDVKPENIIIFSDPDNKLNKASYLDFGLVRFLNEKARNYNQRGTPLFIHYKGIDARTLRPLSGYVDVFGLLISLKLLLAGITSRTFEQRRINEFLYKSHLKPEHLEHFGINRVLLETEDDIPDFTKIPDNASVEEKAFASLLDEVITAGEGQGCSPRVFLKRLLDLYHNPHYNFPEINAAARASQIVELTDQQLENAFKNGNLMFKKLSAKLKIRLEDYNDDRIEMSDVVYRTAERILKQIQNTHPIDRTAELVDQLDTEFDNVLKQYESPIKNAAMKGITNYLRFITDLQSGLITKGPRDNKLLGIFTPFRHGKKGSLRAERLMNEISSDKSSEKEVQTLLLNFLSEKDRRYHKHSLSSFILDELIKTNEKPWSHMQHNERDHRYDPKMIMSISGF